MMVWKRKDVTMGVHAAKPLSAIVYGERSTTRAMSARKVQAYGIWKGVLLPYLYRKDEEMV